jgi:hypothetical protein
LYHLNYRDTGAIILKFEDVFRDLDWIVNFSGYSTGAFDFVVVEPTFDYGIYIEGLNIGISLLNGVYSSNEGDCSLRTVAFLFKEFVLLFIKKFKLLKLMKAVIFNFI